VFPKQEMRFPPSVLFFRDLRPFIGDVKELLLYSFCI
jgi:hypothetical protein